MGALLCAPQPGSGRTLIGVTSQDVSSSFPELHNTIVVAAFEGWNDAGDAASDALEHLDAIWEADPILEIDDEAYYDYQVNRPVIRQVTALRENWCGRRCVSRTAARRAPSVTSC